MLAQVLWKQVSFQSRKKRGAIPQGTVLFVANLTENKAVVVYQDSILNIPRSSLKLLGSEDEVLPLEVIQEKYHNKRANKNPDD